MKLKKNDTVKIMAGKDKGKEGKIERVYTRQGKVIVPQINVYKKHIKKSDKMPQGGLVSIERAIDVSKIALICPKCKKTTRIGYRFEGLKKVRICKKCDAII